MVCECDARARAVQLARVARRAQFRMFVACALAAATERAWEGPYLSTTYEFMTSMCMHMRDDSPHTAPADARSRVNQYLGPPSTMLGVGPFLLCTPGVSYGVRGPVYAPRLPYPSRTVRGTSTVSICSIPSTQYTATRRIKSDYTRSAMWPSLWRERAARVERRGPPHSQPAATSASPSRVSTFPPACAIPTPNRHLRAHL